MQTSAHLDHEELKEIKSDLEPGMQSSIKLYGNNWTHVKAIPNTNLLVSLHHSAYSSANLEIFDLSCKEKARKVFSFEEVVGVTGEGDVTCNSRRNILGAISLREKISYHLFSINSSPSIRYHDAVKLSRKSKWQTQYSTSPGNFIAGFDFDSTGEMAATIDRYGMCLISEINTNNYKMHLQMEMSKAQDSAGRCRWSTTLGDPLLYIKYDMRHFNILDVEKKALTLKSPIQLENLCNYCK